jgi:hypothetical protein
VAAVTRAATVLARTHATTSTSARPATTAVAAAISTARILWVHTAATTTTTGFLLQPPTAPLPVVLPLAVVRLATRTAPRIRAMPLTSLVLLPVLAPLLARRLPPVLPIVAVTVPVTTNKWLPPTACRALLAAGSVGAMNLAGFVLAAAALPPGPTTQHRQHTVLVTPMEVATHTPTATATAPLVVMAHASARQV